MHVSNNRARPERRKKIASSLFATSKSFAAAMAASKEESGQHFKDLPRL